MKFGQLPPEFELESPCSILTTITITPLTPLYSETFNTYIIIIIIVKVCWQHESFGQHPVSELKVSFYWSANTGVSLYRSALKNVTHEFVLTSLAAVRMTFSFYLDGLWDGSLMVMQLSFYWLLLPEFIQNCTQYLCVVYIVFSPGVSLKSKLCNYTIVLIWKNIRFKYAYKKYWKNSQTCRNR